MQSQSLNVLHICISQDDNEREREGERERERERGLLLPSIGFRGRKKHVRLG